MTSSRLPGGGRIDRIELAELHLRWQTTGHGYPGDTLASALLANGIQLVGRSFKYHRPRGILDGGAPPSPTRWSTTGTGGRTEANTRATMIELHDGLIARSQNRWPSLGFDIWRHQRLAVALPERRLLLQDLHVAGRPFGKSSTSR